MKRSPVLFCYGLLTLVLSSSWAAAQEKAKEAGEAPLAARGRIIQVQPEDKRLILKTADGKELSLRIDEDSKLLLNNRNATLSQFREGNRVRVTYKPVEGNQQVVSLTARRFDIEELGKNVKTVLEKTRSLTSQTRTEYLKRVEQALADAEDVVDDLTDQAEKASGTLRKRLLNEAEEIRKHSTALTEQIQKLKSAGNEAWDEIKNSLSETLEKLEKSCSQSQSRESADARFVRLASEGHLLAIHLGNLASERAEDPKVKEMGKHLVQVHTATLQGLLGLSKKKGFISTRSMGPQCQNKADRLFELKGAEFEEGYLRQLLEEGRTLVGVFETEARQGQDADLRAFAGKSLTVLQENLKAAQDLLSQSRARRVAR